MNSPSYGQRHCDLFFFFSSRRRHTRLQGDWSSDVCSSDLVHRRIHTRGPRNRSLRDDAQVRVRRRRRLASDRATNADSSIRYGGGLEKDFTQIGRAAWWGRGEISGVGVSFKKKKRECSVKR